MPTVFVACGVWTPRGWSSGSARTQVRADAQEAGLSGEEEAAYI